MLRLAAMMSIAVGMLLLLAAAIQPAPVTVDASQLDAAQVRQPRTVVFEGFLKHGCPACIIAGRVLDQLSNEYALAGENVVFLEQDVNNPVGNRIDRWWDGYDNYPELYVPLIMLDSGFRISCGAEDYLENYSAMVNQALQRPAGAEIYAGYEVVASNVTVTAHVTNWSGTTLDLTNYATMNALVYERAPVMHTNRFVRSATSQAIVGPIAHGGTDSFTLALHNVPVETWRLARVLVMLDYRPDTSKTAYDMLQAVEAVRGGPPTRTPIATPTTQPPNTATPSMTPTPGPSPTSPPGVPIFLPFAETR